MRRSSARQRRGRYVCAGLLAIVASIFVVAQPASGARCPDPSPGRPARPRPPADGKPLIFYGNGNGHGLGVSQYGARGAAVLGCTATQILSTYYPGTRVRRIVTQRRLDLLMLEGGGHRATVTLESAPSRVVTVNWRHRGTVVAVQRERTMWTVHASRGRTRLVDHTGRVRFSARATSSVPLRAWHGGRVTRLRTYRAGTLVTSRRLKYDATQFYVGGNGLDVRQNFFTNTVGKALDKYLLGLAELPTSWPAATQRVQAIAGRTFAVRQGRPLRPTAVDQYYGGYDRSRDSPTSRWRRAVEVTSNQIVVDSGNRPIDALYSASMGGHTEDPRYVWGGSAVPYLRAVDDYNWNRQARDPYLAWVATFSYRRIAGEFGFDRVTAVTVAPRGSTARHAGVKIVGRVGGRPTTRFISGWDVRQALDLRSPGFVVVTR